MMIEVERKGREGSREEKEGKCNAVEDIAEMNIELIYTITQNKFYNIF